MQSLNNLNVEAYRSLSELNFNQLCFSLKRSRFRQNSEKFLGIVLVAHSASGKSAVLDSLNIDRKTRDMDLYSSRNRCRSSLQMLIEMARLENGHPIFAASNDLQFLSSITGSENSIERNKFLYLYLERPMNRVFENLKLVNTDGHRHPDQPLERYRSTYAKFRKLYNSIADITLKYNGTSVDEMTKGIALVCSKLLDLEVNLPVKEDNGVDGNPPLESKFWNDDLDVGIFHEFNSLLKTSKETNSRFDTMDKKSMQLATRGGYQVFSTDAFPPIAEKNSLSFKKMQDLKWAREEFAGKTVLDIGCQLGFFTFQASALGATQCLGLDVNPKFVDEANKISINYMRNLDFLNESKVKFATKKLKPGDILPVTPDIIVVNSILHWWFIENPKLEFAEALRWLHSNCKYGVYFEGCVNGDESIMREHSIDEQKFNERNFLAACHNLFKTVRFVSRCSYNDRRIVVRLLK